MNGKLNHCFSKESLREYLAGQFVADELDTAEAHFDTCVRCQTLANQIDLPHDWLTEQFRQAFREHSMPRSTPPFVDRSREIPRRTIRDYLLLESLGQGGMGQVFLARHLRLDRMVAVKLLPLSRSAEPRSVVRFEREMMAIGKLRHPNVIRAEDAGEHEGQFYLVMEYLPGCDLSRLVSRVGPLPIGAACELIRQAALGVQHAHELGLIHRDIKPANLLLTESGIVKVLDLGLALLTSPFTSHTNETTSVGQVMGTVDYMAPEQASNSHQIDIRADVYSLGATLYKLLTGVPPFSSNAIRNPMQKLVALATAIVPPANTLRPDIPDELSQILARLLAKHPDDRFACPADVAAALASLADHRAVQSLFGEFARIREQHLEIRHEIETSEPSRSNTLSSETVAAREVAVPKKVTRNLAIVIAVVLPLAALGAWAVWQRSTHLPRPQMAASSNTSTNNLNEQAEPQYELTAPVKIIEDFERSSLSQTFPESYLANTRVIPIEINAGRSHVCEMNYPENGVRSHLGRSLLPFQSVRLSFWQRYPEGISNATPGGVGQLRLGTDLAGAESHITFSLHWAGAPGVPNRYSLSLTGPPTSDGKRLEHRINSAKINPEEWVHVRLEATLNDVGQENGRLGIWWNEIQVADFQNVALRQPNQSNWDFVYIGGDTNCYRSEAPEWKPFRRLIDDIELECGSRFPAARHAITQDNSIGMKLVHIPAGEFLMGALPSDTQAIASEFPRHRVAITHSFLLGQYEVTRGQFKRFVDATDYKTEAEKDQRGADGIDDATGIFITPSPQFNWSHTGFEYTDDHPVVNVTWKDAIDFCDWLSKFEGQKYRLPTEAEWEYACRAGSSSLYVHGSEPTRIPEVGNIADGTAKLRYSDWNTFDTRDGYIYTAPVGKYRPNAFDLYDMTGNVREFTTDWYDSVYYSRCPSENPRGALNGFDRVNRGGGWGHNAFEARCSHRIYCNPSFRTFYIGFRVVCEIPSDATR